MRGRSSYLRALAFAAVLACAFFGPTSSASALRCQHRLVDPGDTSAYVEALCGAPTAVSTRVATITNFGYANGSVAGGGQTSGVAVQVTVWTYDFGPHRLMVELLFLDGVLYEERTTHYGTPNGRAPSSR